MAKCAEDLTDLGLLRARSGDDAAEVSKEEAMLLEYFERLQQEKEGEGSDGENSGEDDQEEDNSDDDSDSGDEEEEVEVGTILSSGQYHVHQHETSATVRIAELEQERDEALQKVEEARSHAERVKGLLQQERTKSAEMSGQAQQATTSLQSVRMRIGRLERDKKLAEGSLANAESQVAPPGPARRL